MDATKEQRKLFNKISERKLNPIDTMFQSCSDESRQLIRELMFSTYKMGVDYCIGLNEGKTITVSEAARISGISEYFIKQAIKLKELSAKRLGRSKTSPIMLDLVEFNLWRSYKNE